MTEQELSHMTKQEYFALTGRLAARGMALKAERGEYPHAAPYGYKNVRQAGECLLEVDPEAAPHVQMAFRLILKGLTVRQVADALNASGARSRRGTKFSAGTVHKILRNPVYVGEIRYKQIVRAAKHLPLITRGLADEVRRVLGERRA